MLPSVSAGLAVFYSGKIISFAGFDKIVNCLHIILLLIVIGQTSSFIFAAEKLAEAIFEPKKILHTRYSKCVYRARRESAEAFFRGKKRWEPIFLLHYGNSKLSLIGKSYHIFQTKKMSICV